MRGVPKIVIMLEETLHSLKVEQKAKDVLQVVPVKRTPYSQSYSLRA